MSNGQNMVVVPTLIPKYCKNDEEMNLSQTMALLALVNSNI